MSEEEIVSVEEYYLNVLNEIAVLNPNDSVAQIIEHINLIPENLQYKSAILLELEKTRIFPEALMKIFTFVLYIQSEREEINKLYEESMERYETINKLTAKTRSTEDESKIKKTLTDFILKIESFFETHDKSIEATIREVNRHLVEQNIQSPLDKELLFYKISARSFTQLQPNLVSLLEVYFNYIHNKNIIRRLIKISNYIIEDAQKKALL
jgi:serine/threonine protein kinase